MQRTGLEKQQEQHRRKGQEAGLKHHEPKQTPEKEGTPKAGYKRPPIHTRFQKGASGNPGGVKKGTVFISEAYKRMIALSPGELKRYKPKSVAEEIAIEIAQNARGDNPLQQSLPAAKEIADRTEGRAPQTVNVTGDIQIESSESRQEWAEKRLTELMKSHRVSRSAAIKQLRAAGATRMLEYLGETV